MDYPKITDDMMAEARKSLGIERRSKQHFHVATEDAIRLYALGIGDDNPLWHRNDHGAETSWGSRLAPPTFMWTAFQAALFFPSESPAVSSGGSFPGIQGIFLGAQYRFNEPIRPGDEIKGYATRVGVVDLENRSEGDLIDSTVDVEEATNSAMLERPSSSSRIVLHVEKFRAHNATTDRPAGEIISCLGRLESGSTKPEEGQYKDVVLHKYTDDEFQKIQDNYEDEPKRRRGSEVLYWNDVAVGDEVPQLVKGPLTLLSYMAFFSGCGAWFNMTDRVLYNFAKRFGDSVKRDPELNIWAFPEEMHWSPFIAGLVGMPIGFDIASQRAGWFAHLITDWMGDEGFLEDLNIWVTRPLFLSESAWLRGKVVDKSESSDPGFGTVTIRIESENQNGVDISHGTARVRLRKRT
jgi:acyl dehydratase